VAGGEAQVLFDFGAVDDQRRGKAELLQLIAECLGLGFLQRDRVDDDQRAFLRLGRKRMLQTESADLLRKIVRMAADDRTEGTAAAAELRSGRGVVTGTARTLLLVHLRLVAIDFRTPLRLVRTGLTLGELPAHDAGQDV